MLSCVANHYKTKNLSNEHEVMLRDNAIKTQYAKIKVLGCHNQMFHTKSWAADKV